MERFILKLREAVEASIEHALSRQEGDAKCEAAFADEMWKELAAEVIVGRYMKRS